MQCFRWSLRIQRSQHCREKRKCIAFLTAYLKCILVCLRIVKGMLLLLCSPALSRALLKRRSNSNNKSISISPVWDFALQHNLSHSACKLSWLLAGYLIKDLDRKSTLLAPFFILLEARETTCLHKWQPKKAMEICLPLHRMQRQAHNHKAQPLMFRSRFG